MASQAPAMLAAARSVLWVVVSLYSAMSKAPTTRAATRNRLQQTANQATIERGNGELPRRRQDSSKGWAPDAAQANIAVRDKMTKVDTDEQRPRAETPPEAFVKFLQGLTRLLYTAIQDSCSALRLPTRAFTVPSLIA